MIFLRYLVKTITVLNFSAFSEAATNITEKCCHCEQIVLIDKLRSHVENVIKRKNSVPMRF